MVSLPSPPPRRYHLSNTCLTLLVLTHVMCSSGLTTVVSLPSVRRSRLLEDPSVIIILPSSTIITSTKIHLLKRSLLQLLLLLLFLLL